ncbi:fatty acid cis/trans isomerase [Uliginosibacterium sp. H3]|uniref:Fatty acid cis/trans isomerase n=1 Tax=Uliginosibacterium silvisoli TaxID=3114758 RepID=A0ABU6JYW9_9RHOO|nr:fatty acid cis/trans isomerase [Uliginosibacterium sp. H3]
MKKIYLVATLLLLVGCAGLVRENLEELFGKPNPQRFDEATPPRGAMSFRGDVQPILDKRCVVCHACYDAPCQLKLTAWEGVARGATNETVYNGARLLEGSLSRLFIDADKPSEWRKRGFFPVLNEYAATPLAEQHASLLARTLELKDQHPVTPNALLPAGMDTSLDRAQQCTPVEGYQDYAKSNPDWGMPYGLPGLTPEESGTIRSWLRLGAPYEGPAPLTPMAQQQIARWEQFLNGNSLREQLVSRYIYEHLFLNHIHFDAVGRPQFFVLVRSSTPPGQKLQEIASRRPFDDPGVARVYYRFRAEGETIVDKSHMPYALTAERMARWKQLFFSTDYAVAKLPTYKPEDTANPFGTFQALPENARYRFLLEEAQSTVMGFIKGPVCRGQTALNVINDHFWVFFLNPDFLNESDASFLQRESRNLTLPSENESNSLVLTPWLRYARQEQSFLEAKSAYYEERLNTPDKVSLDMVWNGDGTNPNASLTVYRHFDSATVLKGLQGEMPKTAWVMGYSLLERIHYLLVAGYDVYGNVGHQLNTRLYMDFLRMESEFNFMVMLPRASRVAVRDAWYREASSDVKDLVYGKYAHFNRESGIAYPADRPPASALMDMLKQRLAPVGRYEYDIDKLGDADLKRSLRDLASVRGEALAWMPEAALLRVESPGQPTRTFSLLRNTAHTNITYLLREGKTLVPAENSMDVLTGIATAYPNAFYRVQSSDLPAFATAVRGLSSTKDYAALVNRFGVRRTNPRFWELSDAINADYVNSHPIEAGWLDYNRLENR